MKLISIIIPVYNVEDYLPRCIDSVLNQTYPNLEIILVNDGSTDRSGKICDEYALKDNRIKVIHQKNSGVSMARNNGLDICSGEYVGFIDSDDYIDSNMYEILIKNVLKSKADISCCGFKQYNLDGSIEYCNGTSEKRILQKNEAIKGFFFDINIKQHMYAPWNKIYSRKMIENLRFDTSLRIGEDLLFVFNCLARSNNIYIEDICSYNYIRRENSAMTSVFSDKRLDYIKAAEIIENECRRYFPTAIKEARQWVFTHKLVICRQLLMNKEYKKKFQEKFQEMKQYLKENKKHCFKKLSTKRKIDFVLVFYLPFAYKILQIDKSN